MRNKPLPGLCPKDSPLNYKGMLEKKPVGPRATTTDPELFLTEKQQLKEHDVEALKDRSLGGKY